MPGKTKDLKVVAKVPKKTKKTVTMDLGTAVKTAVKKELAKAVENKYVMRLGQASTNTIGTEYATEYITPAIPLNSSFRPLLPQLAEGTGGNQRVGKTVTPKYMKVKVHVAFANDIKQSAIRDIRFMFLTNKSVKDMVQLTSDIAGVPNYASELLWNGITASPTYYQGCAPYYNQLPINRLQWNVLEDKVVRIAKSASDNSPASENLTAITAQYAASFEVTIPLPSKFHYDGGSTVVYPSNFAPVMAVGWADPMDNTLIGSTSDPQDVVIEWTSALSYEDA